eukprot:1192293-Prorocentrum_minimum.AAC.5
MELRHRKAGHLSERDAVDAPERGAGSQRPAGSGRGGEDHHSGEGGALPVDRARLAALHSVRLPAHRLSAGRQQQGAHSHSHSHSHSHARSGGIVLVVYIPEEKPLIPDTRPPRHICNCARSVRTLRTPLASATVPTPDPPHTRVHVVCRWHDDVLPSQKQGQRRRRRQVRGSSASSDGRLRPSKGHWPRASARVPG